VLLERGGSVDSDEFCRDVAFSNGTTHIGTDTRNGHLKCYQSDPRGFVNATIHQARHMYGNKCNTNTTQHKVTHSDLIQYEVGRNNDWYQTVQHVKIAGDTNKQLVAWDEGFRFGQPTTHNMTPATQVSPHKLSNIIYD